MTSELENALDDAFKSRDVSALNGFLLRTTNKPTTIKCPQQFLTKLDKLITESLDKKDSNTACGGLAILHKCGRNLRLPDGCQGLPGIIAQGLIKKMVQWFEKCKKLWIQCRPQWDESLSRLSEDFFDAVMVVHEASQEGVYGITESFLYPIGQLVVDARIYIIIKKEAIRKFNMFLEKIPVVLKKEKKMLTSQEASDIMTKLAGQISHCGDYDFQIALIEALFRMTTPDERKELTDHWFSMAHVAGAFVQIQVSEFEADCRRFLNFVNGIQGDRRRVHSLPCLKVYLDKFELLMPVDDKMKEFWIDFNLGSQCISFYFSCAEEKSQIGLWDTICISDNEVQSYTVTEKGKRQVLKLQLSEVVMVGVVQGSSLAIHFSSALDILQIVGYVYGNKKNKSMVVKTSVVETTVNVIMEEGNPQQAVVPESQLSIGDSDKNTVSCLLHVRPTSAQTPAKMRISESTIFINSSSKGSVHEASFLSGGIPSRKPSLEMFPASDRKRESNLAEEKTSDKTFNRGPSPNSTKSGGKRKQNIPVITTGMMLAGQGTDQSQEDCFVPDTQPVTERNESHWSKMSVSEILMMPTQKISYLPKPELCSNLAKKQKCPSSAPKIPDPTRIKQVYTQSTQQPQEVVRRKNPDLGPKEATRAMTLRSDGKGSTGKHNGDSSGSKLRKEVQTQGKDLDKKMSRGKPSLVNDVLSVKAPIKASIYDQERTPNERDARVAGSMVKLISSHYTRNNQTKEKVGSVPQRWIPFTVNRPLFNMSWVSTGKKNVEAGDVTKSDSKDESNFTNKRKDVFAFSIDEPFSVGGRDKILIDKSAISSKGLHDSSVHRKTTVKRQPAAKLKKRQLFSDTDTDYGTTDVSWLRESSKKPKIITYGQKQPITSKALQPYTSYESPILPPCPPKPGKSNTRLNKNIPNVRKMEHSKSVKKSVATPGRPCSARKRPQRAAASAKNYKEPDTDESQSESDKSLATKNKYKDRPSNTDKTNEVGQMNKTKANGKYTTKTYKKLKENPYGCPSKSMTERQPLSKIHKMILHGNMSNGAKIQAREQANMSKCPPSHQASPPSIDKMRLDARSNKSMDIPCSLLLSLRGSPLCSSPNLPCQETSPISRLPKPHSTFSNKIASFSLSAIAPKAIERRISGTEDGWMDGSPIQQRCSSPQSPLSLSPCPQLTSTKLPAISSTPHLTFPEANLSHHLHCGFSQTSIVSQFSLSLSSVCSSRFQQSPIATQAVCQKTEKTPQSDKDSTHTHVSGPSRKRSIPLSSSSEEEEEERQKKKTRRKCPSRLKPRRLLNSFAEVLAEGEMSQVLSTSFTMSSNHWDADVEDQDMENRFKIMDGYNKQGIKSVQQHVSSFSLQLGKHRTQKFEEIKEVLLEEIYKLEQGTALLNSMEKDLSMYWKKQCISFQTYREEETRSQEVLKRTLQSDMCPSLEYEERLFTNQVALIRKDLKTIQERLLKKMQEEELQSVKRSLRALLFPDGASD
ncbi:synaptonemal complex protein 2 isoform X3 [Dunckerocampus dactyliophorus]|uniref:synaptonemal complex protein 2 isoform X3 n=1 Tax=Dunckerocampus dactyliophorus TaxID=161453 RepID=UPI0024068BD0|nr:synaptonemal complex protein 2 isoform X3 [Dunckerocampus dactyliophorus]